MSKLVIQTAPTVEPLTAPELKVHLRIDDSVEDDYLDRLIKSTRKKFEESYWTQLCTATWDQYWDGFPSVFRLRRPPVGTVASVKYTDVAGDEQTVATTVWEQGLINGVAKYMKYWASATS